MAEPIPDLNRLRWQCRRGMLELDEMLLNYLERCFSAAESKRQQAFRLLLAVEDPPLQSWLLGGVTPPDPMVDVVAAVRRCAGV